MTDYPSNGRTALITAFPQNSGVGAYCSDLFRLGLLRDYLFFQVKRSDSANGYTRVFTPSLPYGGSLFLSTVGARSKLGKVVKAYDFIHLGQVNYAHLVHENKNMIASVHDLFPLEETICRVAYSRIYNFYYRKEVRYISKLMGISTLSHDVAKRVIQFFPDTAPVVIHGFTGDEFKRRDMGLARGSLNLPLVGQLILINGSAEPRKNLETLTRALNRLNLRVTILKVGAKLPGRLRHPVIHLPYLPTNLYPLIYNAADVLVQPSLREGFGRPIIEAVNSGTPIVASDIEVFREILGNYPVFVRPLDVEGWVNSISDVLTLRSLSREVEQSYRSIGDYFREERARLEWANFYREFGVNVFGSAEPPLSEPLSGDVRVPSPHVESSHQFVDELGDLLPPPQPLK